MPAYNFKATFAGKVESGVKAHTIRPKRKRPTVPGDTLYLYTGMRTKGCRLLRVETCTDVKPIRIENFAVMLDGHDLTLPMIEALAIGDGFKSVIDFFDFFDSIYGLPFEGNLIMWKDTYYD